MSDDSLEKRIREVIIGEIEQQTIVIADYNPEWPQRFRQEEVRIRAALGEGAPSVEHIGSTSVPGLAAKPIVDILLVVEDSGEETSYLPALEGAGYVLRVREPDFHEHRMFRTVEKDVHVHVFSAGSPEIERYQLLRERLRHNEEERELYARTKRELAKEDWPTIEHYAEAFGMPAWRCESAEDLPKRLGQALSLDVPSVIVLPIDYSIDVAISEELGRETVAT
jgi:GrpB-like predicted nucleotidyltransferase (UPF0157 family)